jgi:hypothetical protein
MRGISIPIAWTLLLACSAVASAQRQDSKPEPKPQEKEEEVLTFNTEDLERMYGKSKRSQPAATKTASQTSGNRRTKQAAADQDPLARLQAQQEAERDKAERLVDARRQVLAAEAKVAEHEARLAALRNPFLGRPQPSAEEQEAWDGSDQAGRLRIAEETLAAARQEAERARKALEEIR